MRYQLIPYGDAPFFGIPPKLTFSSQSHIKMAPYFGLTGGWLTFWVTVACATGTLKSALISLLFQEPKCSKAAWELRDGRRAYPFKEEGVSAHYTSSSAPKTLPKPTLTCQ
jgi:hypothetical protein